MDLDEKAIILRVRQLREQYAGKRGRAVFARALGISASTYNYYEQDRLPPVEIIWAACELTGADITWLLTGRDNEDSSGLGSMQAAETASLRGLVKKLTPLLAADPDAAGPLSAFIDLLADKSRVEQKLSASPEGGPTMRPHCGAGAIAPGQSVPSGAPEAIPDGSGAAVGPEKPDSRSANQAWIPILGSTAAGMVHFWNEAGGSLPGITDLAELIERHRNSAHCHFESAQVMREPGAIDVPAATGKQVKLIQLAEPQSDGLCEFIESAGIRSCYEDAFALRVDGDSMAPRVADGDIVVLSPQAPARDGAAAVVQLRDQIGVTCKIIRRSGPSLHLIPANEKYETKIYPQDQLLWALAVLWRIRLY